MVILSETNSVGKLNSKLKVNFKSITILVLAIAFLTTVAFKSYLYLERNALKNDLKVLGAAVTNKVRSLPKVGWSGFYEPSYIPSGFTRNPDDSYEVYSDLKKYANEGKQTFFDPKDSYRRNFNIEEAKLKKDLNIDDFGKPPIPYTQSSIDIPISKNGKALLIETKGGFNYIALQLITSNNLFIRINSLNSIGKDEIVKVAQSLKLEK